MAYNQFRGRAMMMAGGMSQRGRGGMAVSRGGGYNPMQAFRQPFMGQSPNRGMGYQGGNMQKSSASNSVKPAPIPPKPSPASTPKSSPATTPAKATSTGSSAQTTPTNTNSKPTTPASSAEKAGQKPAGATPAKPATTTSAAVTKQSPSTAAKPGQSPASTPGKPAQTNHAGAKPGQSPAKPAQSPASAASKPAQSPAASKPAQTPTAKPSQSPASQPPKPAQSPSPAGKQGQKPEQNTPASQQGKGGPNQGRPGQNQQKPGQNQPQQKPNQQQLKPGQNQQQLKPGQNQQQKPGQNQQHRPGQDQRQGGGGTQMQQQKFGQSQAQQQGRPRPSNPQNQAGQKRPFSRFQDHPPTEQQQRQHEQYRQERREERQQAQQQGVYMQYGGDDEEQPEEMEEEMEEEQPQEGGIVVALSALRKPGEKTYTQRCRLFVGNLPADITEEEFKKLFEKYGEPGEVFINKGKGFGFIKLESRALSEIAKAELDDLPMRGRQLRVRFATHAAALSVKNLSPFVSNDLLEEAFSQFGPVERAIVIVDDRGRSTGKGIVEFASKPAARKAFDRCNDGVFLLTSTPQPVIVEPLEQFDQDDGLPEKLAQKHPLYMKEREHPPRFAQHGSFEYEYSKRWKALDDMEKQQRDQVEKNLKDAKEKLESEMDDAYHDHQANLMRQDLMRRQQELQRMEDIHTQEMMKRKELQMRQEEERHRREEMIIRQRDMEEQMRRQREEAYRMSYMDPRERELRMTSGAMGAADPYSAASQQYAMPGQQAVGYEDNPGPPPAAGASAIDPDMRNERYAQGSASTGPAGSSAPRGMGAGPPSAGTAAASYSRGRDEYEGPNKKPRY